MTVPASKVVLPNGTSLSTDLGCTLRDGLELATDVYYPPSTQEGPFPTLLLRTPYGKIAAQSNDVLTYAHPSWYAARGYIVAVQDVRGRHASDGEFDAFRNEAADGVDAIEWCANLKNATGTVGMYGMSYGGYAQLAAAAMSPPALTCIAPGCISPRLADIFVTNSLPRISLLLSWGAGVAFDQAQRAGAMSDARSLHALAHDPTALYHLVPLIESAEFELIAKYLPFIREWLTRDPSDQEYWEPFDVRPPAVPALYITGWYDTWIRELVEMSQQQASAGGLARLLVGPWGHVPWRHALTANCSPSPDRLAPTINELHAEWFDWHLKGTTPSSWLKDHDAQWYDYGAGEWRQGRFGAQAAEERLTIWSNGLATVSDHGRLIPSTMDVSEPAQPDMIVDDPLVPTPSVGGWSCCYEATAPIGPKDQAPAESLGQVAVYTTDPFEHPVRVEGIPTLELTVVLETLPSTVFATLCLVRNGRSVNVARGMWRSADDDSSASWSRCDARLALAPVALTLRPGDRIRLDVHCSSFPEVAPDPHVPGPAAAVALGDVQVARTMVLGGDVSALTLPMVAMDTDSAHDIAAAMTELDDARINNRPLQHLGRSVQAHSNNVRD